MRDKIGDKHRLQHILNAIAELDDFVEGVAFSDFEVNRMMQQACVRNLIIYQPIQKINMIRLIGQE